MTIFGFNEDAEVTEQDRPEVHRECTELALLRRHAAHDVITTYLVNAPEQGEWEWEDHCDGLALGLLGALTAAGWELVRRGKV